MHKIDDKKKKKKATATEVAELAGVSKYTVLRAFKDGASISSHAREAVMEAANKLGFRPNLLARSLKNQKTNLIAILVDEFQNPHTLMILDEVSKQLGDRGYMTILFNVSSEEEYMSVLNMAGQMQVDGMIFAATILRDELIVTAKELYHVPSFHICRSTDNPDVDVVNIDGFDASKQLGELLIQQGYKRFAYMKGHDTPSSQLMRIDGFRTSLKEANKNIDKIFISGHYDRELSYKLITEHLKNTPEENRIDALFCENDVLAVGAIQAVRDFGQGAHIGIVGFDDIAEARTTTWELTTWSQRADLQITEAINRLIDGISDENGDWRFGEIRVRKSHLKPTL
ncbi:LacI family DNA-binding transcriptional regulator [Erwinia typographi]|uniref:LacI family DNA-binding transcriptional regulator n=1 Tax=Erwinia typographi TaxID=371042 RepID=UPI00068BBEA8|nr:LacI family DNA-binding transcriptional regulator [Erwinia typographi]